MSAQLTLLDAALAHADTGEDHQWLPGDDVVADIDAVIGSLPTVGHRKGTHRESIRRPIAYLYARTALLDGGDRKRVQGIARACTGFVDTDDGVRRSIELIHEEQGGPLISVPWTTAIWVRLNGEPPRTGREATRDFTPSDRTAVWRLDFRTSDTARGPIKDWRTRVTPGLRALGCAPGPKAKRLLLPAIAPLVLALRWDDATQAAVFLAGSGVAPKSDAWAVLVDQAQDQPWYAALALLSARHSRDVMSRALDWVHAQGMDRRSGR